MKQFGQSCGLDQPRDREIVTVIDGRPDERRELMGTLIKPFRGAEA
jgi:hypothetical protein